VTSGTAAVPSTIDDVNAEWLTAVLRADETVPDAATVTDVRAEQIALDSGSSSQLYRLHVTGDHGMPSSLIVKLPADSEAGEAMRTLVATRGRSRSTAMSPVAHPCARHTCTPPAWPRTPRTSYWCWRTCDTGTTPIISPACRWTALAAV
jgi:hypothetical protein